MRNFLLKSFDKKGVYIKTPNVRIKMTARQHRLSEIH